MYNGLHHVGLLVEDLERSLEFYMGVLGLEQNNARPDSKLPYRGAWLWIGRFFITFQIISNFRCFAFNCCFIVRRRKWRAILLRCDSRKEGFLETSILIVERISAAR